MAEIAINWRRAMSNSVLANFKTDEINVIRFTQGQFDKGVYVEGEKFEFDISCVAQPLSPREIQSLPEAQRQTDSIRIYCDTELMIVNEEQSRKCDLVIWRGRTYEIRRVDVWQNVGGLTHYKCIAVLADRLADKRNVK